METADGPVTGQVSDGIGVFLGLPYGTPLTPDNWFCAPLPPEPWSAPLRASAFGPAAPRDGSGLFDLMLSGDPGLNGRDTAGANDAYAAGASGPYSRSGPAEVFAAVMSDRMFRIPSYRVAEARRDAPAATYVYELGWRSPVTIGTDLPLGACHVSDIPFAWDTLGAAGTSDLTGDAAPASLAAAMHARWIEFARAGELSDWPAYGSDRPVMTFARDSTASNEVVPDPRGGERRLWDGAL